jgi:hypothetical protein
MYGNITTKPLFIINISNKGIKNKIPGKKCQGFS